MIRVQSAGEEFAFRGVLLQTVGSIVKYPLIAIAVEALIFGISHTYNVRGIIEVTLSGFLMGIMVYLTNGLEAASAAHAANNIAIFIMRGLGYYSAQETQWAAVIETVVIDLLFIAFIYFVGLKRNWFDR